MAMRRSTRRGTRSSSTMPRHSCAKWYCPPSRRSAAAARAAQERRPCSARAGRPAQTSSPGDVVARARASCPRPGSRSRPASTASSAGPATCDRD
jgi:hypothetical protein